jgi:hypothetical protein
VKSNSKPFKFQSNIQNSNGKKPRFYIQSSLKAGNQNFDYNVSVDRRDFLKPQPEQRQDFQHDVEWTPLPVDRFPNQQHKSSK